MLTSPGPGPRAAFVFPQSPIPPDPRPQLPPHPRGDVESRRVEDAAHNQRDRNRRGASYAVRSRPGAPHCAPLRPTAHRVPSRPTQVRRGSRSNALNLDLTFRMSSRSSRSRSSSRWGKGSLGALRASKRKPICSNPAQCEQRFTDIPYSTFTDTARSVAGPFVTLLTTTSHRLPGYTRPDSHRPAITRAR